MKPLPNILITGTPGTGKTTLAAMIAKESGMQHLNISEIAKEHNCLDGYDDELQCPILDEEKLLDEMETLMPNGGKVVEYHSCEFFPKRFFDIVFVLRTDNTVLYDRLSARGYTGKKLSENMECEILAVIRDEAFESYDEGTVHELSSDKPEDLERNLSQVLQWIEAWKRDNGVL